LGGRSRGSRSKPLLEDPAWLVTNKMQQISINKTLFTTRHPARRPAKKKTLTTSRCVETQKTQEILPHFLFTFEKGPNHDGEVGCPQQCAGLEGHYILFLVAHLVELVSSVRSIYLDPTPWVPHTATQQQTTSVAQLIASHNSWSQPTCTSLLPSEKTLLFVIALSVSAT